MYIVYTKPNCPYCVKAKNLLSIKSLGYNEIEIGKDITREEFIETFPNVKTVPHIICNGVEIGGYDQLARTFDA